MALKHRQFWFIFIMVALSLTILACGSSDDDDSAQIDADKWQQDVEYYGTTLESNHPNLFWNIPRAQYREQVDQLYNAVPEMESYEIVLELARITSMMANHKDDHTSIGIWSMTEYIKFFPIRVRWFSDGVYVLDAEAPYSQILEQKLTRIENTAIDDVLKAVSDYVSHGNDMWLLEMAPDYIMVPELLYKLGIIENRASATFYFEDAMGSELSVDVSATPDIPSFFYERYPGSHTITDLPAYRRNVEKNYWFEYLPEDKIIYVAYNACENMKEQTFTQFTNEVIAFMDGHETNKLIFDLRNNYGGNSEIINPFQKVLIQYPDLNTEGKLFIAIGRGTFSSGVMACESITYATDKALFIGEPTGGLVSNGTYGDIRASFSLPNSDLHIACSGTYFDDYVQDEPTVSFMPDIDISISSADYFAGEDPVMNYILYEHPE